MSAIEAELCKLTGLERQKKEGVERWQKRLITAIYALPEEEFDKISEEAFEYGEAAVKAINDKEPVPPFPNGDDASDEEEDETEEEDEAEEEESEEDETEEEDDDEEEEEESEEDETEEEDDDEEEEEESEEETDEGEEPSDEPEEEPEESMKKKSKKKVGKRSAIKAKAETKKKAKKSATKAPKADKTRKTDTRRSHTKFRLIVCKNLHLSRKELIALGEAKGIELSQTSLGSIVYHVQKTVQCLRDELGVKIPMKKSKKND